MIAVDTQILVFAHREDSPLHPDASVRLVELAESGRPWAIPWPCVHEFLNTVTRPRIYDPPTPMDRAFAAMDAWLRSPGLVLLSEGHDHFDILRRLVTGARVQGAAIHDARIAAICLAHGVSKLWTLDRDFSRFPALNVENPLNR